MNDIKELYFTFIEHISLLKIEKNKVLIENVSNAMNILDKLENTEVVLDNELENFFINKMNTIFENIKEKKNVSIVEIESFNYFLKCIKSKPEDNISFLNLFHLDEYELNIYEIGNYLQNNDEENYHVFYNHFLLLYIEVCNHLFEDETSMPENVKNQYNMILDKFTEDSFDNETLGENIVELLQLIVDIVFKNNMNTDKYIKIISLLDNKELPTVINQIVQINMNTKELEDANHELKRMSKNDIKKKINFYFDKLNNINISQIIQNFDLKNILNGDLGSIMNLMSSDVFSNLSNDLMQNIPMDLLDNLPDEATGFLESFTNKS